MVVPMDPIQAFDLAVEHAGSESALARAVGCTPGNINQLRRKRSPISASLVLKAEASTGISRHDLRPDLYPREVAPAPATTGSEIAR